jgi:hypothetical protein
MVARILPNKAKAGVWRRPCAGDASDWIGVRQCATRSELICLDRRLVKALAPAAHGPDRSLANVAGGVVHVRMGWHSIWVGIQSGVKRCRIFRRRGAFFPEFDRNASYTNALRCHAAGNSPIIRKMSAKRPSQSPAGFLPFQRLFRKATSACLSIFKCKDSCTIL